MIGGTVIETVIAGDKVWINCEEKQSTRTCAIYVRRTAKSEKVRPADTIWWQGSYAMWTPYENAKKHKSVPQRCGIDYDIKLERIGYSGASKPQSRNELAGGGEG